MRTIDLALVVTACTASLLCTDNTSAQGPRAVQLSWLSGCWENRRPGRLTEEHWMTPRGGIMLGMARTTRGDSLMEFEQVRIGERGGQLVYTAQPSGQAQAEFTSTEVGDSMVVFANPGHDFPQRVIYRRRGADSLLARIEGTMNGNARAVDFPYARGKCPN